MRAITSIVIMYRYYINLRLISAQDNRAINFSILIFQQAFQVCFESHQDAVREINVLHLRPLHISLLALFIGGSNST